MIKRKPLEYEVFEDIKTAKKYNKESGKWMRKVAKSFVTVAKKWGITKGKILDIGTGPGSLAIEFAKKIPGVEVIGLDLSDVVLMLAKEKVQKTDVSSRVSFERGDAENIPFEDDTFDLVISSNTLHLVKKPIKMFDEIQRVLKPKGRFFMSDFRRSLLGIFTEHIRASYSSKEIKDLLSRSKLQNWEINDSLFWLSISSKDQEV